jgi:DNA replication and repair protein RecF
MPRKSRLGGDLGNDVPGEPLSGTFISRLTLTNVRNHRETHLELDQRPVCLFGQNGAGKTAVLEALSLLSPGKALRGVDIAEIARKDGGGGWTVSARLEQDGEDPVQIGVGLEEGVDGKARRVVRIDGATATPAKLARHVRMTWITPAMDRLFTGPAGDRRRFLDRLTLGHFPDHGSHVAAYERAMRTRQRLLEENGDKAWIAGAEIEMAKAAAATAIARANVVRRIQAAIDARPEGEFPHADVAISGRLEMQGAENIDATDIEQGFLKVLADGRPRDKAAGRALDGPHRSDLLVRHISRDMPADACSTGEQKALLFGLMLANARALSGAGLGAPIVLIDEAGAHFDETRRAALYEELLTLGGQTWLTGTERSLFTSFGPRAQLLETIAGTIKPSEPPEGE